MSQNLYQVAKVLKLCLFTSRLTVLLREPIFRVFMSSDLARSCLNVSAMDPSRYCKGLLFETKELE